MEQAREWSEPLSCIISGKFGRGSISGEPFDKSDDTSRQQKDAADQHVAKPKRPVNGIPVELDGGSGTAGSHWDEETFNAASFADLGYVITPDYQGWAEDYVLV